MTVNVFSFRRSHNLHCKCPAALCKNSSASPYPKRSGQIIRFDEPRLPCNKAISLPQLPFGVRSCDVATNLTKYMDRNWNQKSAPLTLKGKRINQTPSLFLAGGSMFMFSVVYRFWVRGKTNFQQFFSRWMSRRS